MSGCRASVSSSMSHSSEEDDQRKAESPSRMWAEPEAGPSRHQPSRQGYCGYCRVLYSSLDQHLSSLKHLDTVHAASRGSSSASSTSSSRTKMSLLERFLQDVLQHHPHHYKDPRPSHADLPSVCTPPLPREELNELFSDESRSLGTREHPPSSDEASCQPANQGEDSRHSRPSEGGVHERLCAPIREGEDKRTSPVGHTHISHEKTLQPQVQAPPTVHRKAHRKTNRRKTSDSSSSPPGRAPGPWNPGPWTPSELRPWHRWQKERREAHKEEAFSSEHLDPVEQTMEEVIQRYCHGRSSSTGQQEELEELHLSLPISMEAVSDNWDSAVQVALHTPIQVSHMDEQEVTHLMDLQVLLENQLYQDQLDSALHSKQLSRGGAKLDKGFWTLPMEEVLPAPEHIPESFRGKSWAQIEQEDEEKVDRLVRQFRRERFTCYFDSESLARYGRRSQSKKEHCEIKDAESDTGAPPLLDADEEDSAGVRRRRRKRRVFRVASRCQVVKVSHSTQTVRLVVPAVRQSASEAPPTSILSANQEAAERTPDVQAWRCLPSTYSNIVTPLQPRTSLVYLLSTPTGSTDTPGPCSAPKRCRKKRRPLDLQGLKFKYKQLPVRFYDPGSNRILKNPPKGFLWRRGSASSNPPPPCVRQLFRSLSPDLNADRLQGEGPSEFSRVKGQRSSEPPFSHGNTFLLGTLSRDSAQTDKQDPLRRRGRMAEAPPITHIQSEVTQARTHPPSAKKQSRASVPPLQPRREGLRRTGTCRRGLGSAAPSHCAHPRRGRSRRRRGCRRSQR